MSDDKQELKEKIVELRKEVEAKTQMVALVRRALEVSLHGSDGFTRAELAGTNAVMQSAFEPEILNSSEVWDKEELQAHERTKQFKVLYYQREPHLDTYAHSKQIIKDVEKLTVAELKQLNPNWEEILDSAKEADHWESYYDE